MAITYTAQEPQKAPEYKPLPAGEYPFKVVDAVEKKSKSSGNEMIELTLRVNGEDGVKVWDYLVFADKALWKVDQFLATLGYHPGAGKEYAIEATDLIGEEGRCVLAVEKNDKGREVNKVESYVTDGF